MSRLSGLNCSSFCSRSTASSGAPAIISDRGFLGLQSVSSIILFLGNLARAPPPSLVHGAPLTVLRILQSKQLQDSNQSSHQAQTYFFAALSNTDDPYPDSMLSISVIRPSPVIPGYANERLTASSDKSGGCGKQCNEHSTFSWRNVYAAHNALNLVQRGGAWEERLTH